MQAMPKGQICTNDCDHLAHSIWLGEGNAMNYVHGNYTYWCKCCQVDYQLEYARKLAKNIPFLEKELIKALELCNSLTPYDV